MKNVTNFAPLNEIEIDNHLRVWEQRKAQQISTPRSRVLNSDVPVSVSNLHSEEQQFVCCGFRSFLEILVNKFF